MTTRLTAPQQSQLSDSEIAPRDADHFARARSVVASLDFESILRALTWAAICLGIFLRLLAYIHNRALWVDEIQLSRNIEERSFLGLLKPLDYDQTAPIGFLLLQKLAVLLLGDNEYALRLVPFLAGLVSLLIFFRLTKRYLAPSVFLIALFLFSISDRFVYYSAEAKQYSSDVAIALLLLLAAMKLRSTRLSPAKTAAFGMLGAAVVWFSHPSVFVLAGIATSIILSEIYRKNWTNAGRFSLAAIIWLVSFVGCYFASLRTVARSDYFQDFWSTEQAFMPSSKIASWFVTTSVRAFENPSGFSLPIVAAIVFLAGCAAVFLNKQRHLLLLLSPIPFVLLASVLHKYPFLDRLLLFIVPSIIVFVSVGISSVLSRTRFVGILVLATLLFGPVAKAAHTAVRQDSREDIKLALGHIRDHWQPGDTIYVFYSALQEYWYYAEKYGFTEDSYVRGKRDKESREITTDVDLLKGRDRVWSIFVVHTDTHEEYREILLRSLDNAGPRLDALELPRMSVYLHDLSGR